MQLLEYAKDVDPTGNQKVGLAQSLRRLVLESRCTARRLIEKDDLKRRRTGCCVPNRLSAFRSLRLGNLGRLLSQDWNDGMEGGGGNQKHIQSKETTAATGTRYLVPRRGLL